jgi:hypothetical protein
MAEPAFDDRAAAEWAAQRPAPRARSGAEIRGSLEAIVALARCGDRRCEALAKGGYFAARWVGGEAPVSPASGRELPEPNFDEVAAEIRTAGRAAAGVQTFPNASWCDEGRIAARGVEEWLAWVFISKYPRPAWLVAGTPLDDVCAALGRVGLGPVGLVGPRPSGERFAYDVADVIEAVTG